MSLKVYVFWQTLPQMMMMMMIILYAMLYKILSTVYFSYQLHFQVVFQILYSQLLWKCSIKYKIHLSEVIEIQNTFNCIYAKTF